jgi:TolB-like protein/DNA-binding winged helix-turn-helix (wHTH) protein/Tfp pilus assembly protein PilF
VPKRAIAVPNPSKSASLVRFGPFEVDFHAGELLKNGRRIRLQDQPLQVLAMLLEKPGEVVTREELRQRLWPADTFVDFDHGLNNAINRLREALNDSADARRFIETLPRRGYRFIAELSSVTPAPIEESPQVPSAERSIAPTLGVPRLPAIVTVPMPLPRREWKRLWLAAPSIGIAVVVILGLYLARAPVFRSSASVKIQSVVVLPLDNLSGDPSQDYFADGMTDAVTTYLAQLHTIRVISRTSAMQYKASKKRLPEIARELNVDGVIEGTVQQSARHVFVSVRLLDANTERKVWGNSYEMDLGDISAERQIAHDIVEGMRIRLTPQDQARLSHARAVNPEAYELYLRAKLHTGSENRQDNAAAMDLLEKAVTIDPSFAQALAALSYVYTVRFAVHDPKQKLWEEKAYAAAEKARSLDPGLAETYVARGRLLWTIANNFPHQQAIAECQHAVILNPNLAEAHFCLAYIYNHIGLLEKGQEEIQKAVLLDPLNSSIRQRVAVNLLYEGRYQEALTAMQGSQRFFPQQWTQQHAFALLHLGRRAEAAADVEELISKNTEDVGGMLAGMQALIAASG